MLILTILLLFITVWLGTYSLFGYAMGRRTTIHKRLEAIAYSEIVEDKPESADASFMQRVVRPILEWIYIFFRRLSPERAQKRLENSLRQAGRYRKNAEIQWMALQWIAGGLLPLTCGVAVFRLTGKMPQAMAVALLGALTILIFLRFLLIRDIRIRKESMVRQLPDALDVITVSVEAGLSFDGAVERVVSKMDSALGQELGIALKEMRMGKVRRQALKDLSDRCMVPDITSWTSAMIQADELGVSVGNVLRIQSVQMREKRRQRAREKSMQAPIKILFPLIFFIFPSIFIVILGPAAIQIIQTLSKMG